MSHERVDISVGQFALVGPVISDSCLDLSLASLHSAAGVAVGTVDSPQIAKIDGMLELRIRLVFSQDAVTDRAFLADLLTVLADVLIVMTAETSAGHEVTDVVGMRAPVDLHFRESRRRKNRLQRRDGLVDLRLLRAVHGRIGLLVVRRKLRRDCALALGFRALRGKPLYFEARDALDRVKRGAPAPS